MIGMPRFTEPALFAMFRYRYTASDQQLELCEQLQRFDGRDAIDVDRGEPGQHRRRRRGGGGGGTAGAGGGPAGRDGGRARPGPGAGEPLSSWPMIWRAREVT